MVNVSKEELFTFIKMKPVEGYTLEDAVYVFCSGNLGDFQFDFVFYIVENMYFRYKDFGGIMKYVSSDLVQSLKKVLGEEEYCRKLLVNMNPMIKATAVRASGMYIEGKDLNANLVIEYVNYLDDMLEDIEASDYLKGDIEQERYVLSKTFEEEFLIRIPEDRREDARKVFD